MGLSFSNNTVHQECIPGNLIKRIRFRVYIFTKTKSISKWHLEMLFVLRDIAKFSCRDKIE
jgi:hypothetical protein